MAKASNRKRLLRSGVDVRADHVEFLQVVADGTGRPVGDILGMAIQIGCEVLQSHAHLGIDPCRAARVTVSYEDPAGLPIGAFSGSC